MKEYLEVYEKNKKLDNIFLERYGDSIEIENKNILELLVELGEFANESKVFKYWSIKKPKDKDIVLEEAADCLLMIMYFCHRLDMDLSDIKLNDYDEDATSIFIRLFDECSELKGDIIESRLINALNDLILVVDKLGYSNKDFIKICLKKININFERLNSDY
jgi:dimeric dUTPase (all-alpha-NTP-PPase superfamily)